MHLLELRRRGADVRVMKQRDGRVDLRDDERLVDRNTTLVELSWVSMYNGFQHDLTAMCDLAHAHSALVFADIIQGVGAVPLDVRATGAADAATGGAVELAELRALPTDARDPVALGFTIPGVAQARGFFGDAPKLSISGANSLYTQYVVDGLDNNEGFLGGPRVEFPLAALSRLEVLVNSYAADIGRSPTVVVSYETRSGGERWSGELLAYNRPGIPFVARAPPGRYRPRPSPVLRECGAPSLRAHGARSATAALPSVSFARIFPWPPNGACC